MRCEARAGWEGCKDLGSLSQTDHQTRVPSRTRSRASGARLFAVQPLHLASSILKGWLRAKERLRDGHSDRLHDRQRALVRLTTLATNSPTAPQSVRPESCGQSGRRLAHRRSWGRMPRTYTSRIVAGRKRYGPETIGGKKGIDIRRCPAERLCCRVVPLMDGEGGPRLPERLTVLGAPWDWLDASVGCKGRTACVGISHNSQHHAALVTPDRACGSGSDGVGPDIFSTWVC